MRDVAPPRRRWGEPEPPGPALLMVDVVVERRCLDLGVTASLLSDVMAARGGLVGGDGNPEEGTSGIPLCPGNAGSAVVKSLEGRSGVVDEVAAGKDVGLAGSGNLAVITVTVI